MKVNAVIAFMRVRIYKTTIILSDRDNCLDIVTPSRSGRRYHNYTCMNNERCDIEKEASKREFAKAVIGKN